MSENELAYKSLSRAMNKSKFLMAKTAEAIGFEIEAMLANKSLTKMDQAAIECYCTAVMLSNKIREVNYAPGNEKSNVTFEQFARIQLNPFVNVELLPQIANPLTEIGNLVAKETSEQSIYFSGQAILLLSDEQKYEYARIHDKYMIVLRDAIIESIGDLPKGRSLHYENFDLLLCFELLSVQALHYCIRAVWEAQSNNKDSELNLSEVLDKGRSFFGNIPKTLFEALA